MTTAHSAGSYNEPILISDEEDAAFVENELNRWTDSSNSSHNSPPYDPFTTSYSPTHSPTLPPVPAVSSFRFAPDPISLSGQKRKWTDMRDSTSSSNAHSHSPPEPTGGGKKKKKQRRERQRVNPPSSTTSLQTTNHTPHLGHGHSTHDATLEPPSGDFSPSTYFQVPYDSFGSYGFSYQDSFGAFSAQYVSPEDEYRPTDGPLWNPHERPSTLSALATPWYPSHTSATYTSSETQLPARPSSPPSDPPHVAPISAPSLSRSQPNTHESSEGSSSDLSAVLQQSFDSSLNERLRQIEALSASLLALAGGPSHGPGAATTSADAGPKPMPLPSPPKFRSEPLPPKPPPPTQDTSARGHGESLKRLIGVPEDKGDNGFFDLAAPNLEPPASSTPIPPVAEFTLVMTQLPKKFRKLQFVTTWAKRHGTPVRVVLNMKTGKALVEWVATRAVEAAFTSLRLKGDGKEHIRVFRYRGAVPPARPAPGSAAAVAEPEKEIEEGEIEEGELVETSTKTKKKKNKGKKKALQLEQRLTEPAAPAPLAATFSRQPPPHLPLLPSDNQPVTATASVVASSTSSTSSLRPPLMDRFSDAPVSPPRRREEAWEEEMDLDSDDEDHKASLPLPVVQSSLRRDHETEEEDMDLDDDGVAGGDVADVEDDDMDMEMSSNADDTPPPPPPPEQKTPPHPANPKFSQETPEPARSPEITRPSAAAVASPVTPSAAELAIAAAKEARRQKLEEAIARTKAELAMRAMVTSSRTSLVSSNGSSESPEPMTPLDSPSLDHAEVAIAPSTHTDIITANTKGFDSPSVDQVVVKTEVATVNLDDLATSFIAETIHAAAVSPRTPSPAHPAIAPSAISTSVQSRAQATLDTPSHVVAAPVPATLTTVTITLSEEQRKLKGQQYMEVVDVTRQLLQKILNAKTKEEKDPLMRLMRSKTAAATRLKKEYESGVAIVEVHNPSPVPSFASASSTPTPVPSSRMSSATPTPTSTPAPGPTMSSKGKAVQMPMFRWPETAREIIIIVSDDEADY